MAEEEMQVAMHIVTWHTFSHIQLNESSNKLIGAEAQHSGATSLYDTKDQELLNDPNADTPVDPDLEPTDLAFIAGCHSDAHPHTSSPSAPALHTVIPSVKGTPIHLLHC